MTKKSTKVEVNTFIQGLITEASPLNFPPNASLDEENFELHRDGTRDRRLGIDFEDGYTLRDEGLLISDFVDSNINTFLWRNFSSILNISVLVLQVRKKLLFFSTTLDNISTEGFLGSVELNVTKETDFSFAVVDDYLIVVNGLESVFIVNFVNGNFSVKEDRIKTRDLWGVEDLSTTSSQIFSIIVSELSSSTINFNASTNTISCSNAVFDRFSLMVNGDYFTITNSINNNRQFKFISYNSSTNTVTVESGVINETLTFTADFQSSSPILQLFNTIQHPNGNFIVATHLQNDLKDLTVGTNILIRPTVETDAHIYNLRNQSWALPKIGSDGVKHDPINWYHTNFNAFPSNSESVWISLDFRPVADSAPIEQMFTSKFDEAREVGLSAPKGDIVIDVLRRGTSRVSQLNEVMAAGGIASYIVDSLPSDYTQEGASCITSYAGRVFYAGFGSSTIDGDSKSPRLSSYIFFSQLVNNPEDVVKCYQEGSPASRGESDIVDTDGGFILIKGVGRVLSMSEIRGHLIVLADNGVWSISGGTDTGFVATNYIVKKLSSFGVYSKNSVVSIGDAIFFWAEDGIYNCSADQFGDLKVSNITQATIQTLYDNLPDINKSKAMGIFDSFDKKIRWLYNTDRTIGNNNFVYELILDLQLGAFTRNKIYNLATNTPEVIGFVECGSYRSGFVANPVVVNNVPVTVQSVDVVTTESIRQSGTKSVKYLTVVPSAGKALLTFSLYKDFSFKDWKTQNNVGVDAKAYLLTGAVTAGDSSVAKQIPYLIMHMRRTEEGVDEFLNPLKQSSVLIRSQWDWANSINSGKWSPLFQAYRYRRPYFATDINDPFDNGFETVVTRNKIRGRGRAFSFYLETEPNKDCRILGWNLSVNGNSLA